MSPLAGRVALITGASGGIGAALARSLAGRGVRLLLSGRDPARLAALAAEAAALGAPEVACHAADLADDGAVPALAAALAERFGGADLLLHSIGRFGAGEVATTPVEELDRLYRVNLRVPYQLTQLCLPALCARRGQVVFVNSTAGLVARGATGAYAATKHALKALADSLRQEVNRDGVRVLTVYPGRTASAMQEEVCRFEGQPYRPERLMRPEDVAVMVLQALELPLSVEVTDLTLRPAQL